METGVVTIQEPVSTKTNVGEAPAAVILDHSSMEVHKVNLSTVLDDEITSGDHRKNIIPETDVAEVIVEKPVIEEDQTEAKHSPEQGEEIDNVSKAREEIPMKTDEVKEEKDSRTVETSVNGTEAEHNATVSVEEISRNGDNIVNEAVPGDQTATNGESLHDVETTKRVLLEVKKEEEESVPVEAIKNLDDAEQISREVTVDKEKEEDIIQNTEEVQESHKVMETPTKNHEEDIEKISKDTEEHEHVLVRDIPQGETLVTEAETVDTTTVEEARILKTNINETEAHSAVVGEKEGQEIKENTKPSQDLKDDKEQEEIETIKTIISSDEVRSSDVQAKGYGEHTEPCSSEIKDESHGREEYIEVKSKETVPEKETATQVEKEEDKEEMKIDEEPRLDAIEKVETETVKTIIVEEDPEIVNNEETSVHESESFKENAEPVEAIKYSEDAEQTSHEVTVDRENEEEITQKTEEIQERPSVIETSKIQGEDMESTASLEPKEEVDHSSKDTDGHEHELERDIPHCEILKAEAVETNEDIKLILDHKEDKEKEETERVKTVISSDEVRPSAVQEEEFGEHIEPCSSEIKDESHGREESVEVKSKETVQDESTEEKHEDILDVPSTESEKYQDNEPEKALVANTESQEKFEESPSVLALNVDKEEQNDEKIKVDEADGTKIMEEQRGLDLNEPEIEQIDRNRTDETEEIPVAKPVVLQDVESVEQIQKPSPESPSQVSEELSKTVDEKIDEKTEEEEVTLHQEDQEEGSYGLETKKETVSVPESIEIGEKSQEERSVIDLTPLQEESSQPNEQKEETKLEKHELTNEEVKSDEVIEDSSASLSKELEGETVVEAAKIETKKENEEEPAAVDNIQKSPEAVETVESHCSLPSSSEEQEHGTVFEKIEDEKVEEEPMVQIKSHERQGEVSKAVEEQTIDIEPSLTEKYSENIVNEKYALHSAEAAEEETAINGESLHDVETTKRVLPEVEKEEEEAEIKTDAEPRLDVIEKEEIETTKTVVEDAKIFNNEGATAHEYETLKGDNHQDENAKSEEAIKNSDDEEKISSEVIGDREKDEDITQKAEEVQESPRVIEIPTIQGEDNESKTSLELKEEVDKSSKDTEQHEHVLERDIPQCETLKAEAVDTSTVQDAAIFNTLETNISETEAVHTEMSLDLKLDKEQKEAETVKAVIFPDEVRPSDQVHVQEEVFGEHTEPCTLEIKNESQGREESVEVISKETVQDESSEEKDVNLLDVRFGESEKYQENEPVTSLVSKIESGDKFEESVETTYSQTLVDVESVEKAQNTSLETPPELSEETSKTLDEKIEDKPIEEVTLHQEGQDDDSNGLETKEETISVTESRELGEKSREEESCLQNEQEKEVKLQKEQVDKHEPTKEEVYNDQQSPLEEKSDEVIQVSSTSPSEGPEDETVVEAEMIGEEQVADKIQKKFETVETSSLPSSSEEQEHVTVSEKTNGEEVKEAEPIGDMRERGLEIAETTHLSLPSVDQKENVKAFDEELQIPSLTSPLDEQENVTSTEIGETKANETEDDKLDEHVDSSMFSENKDNDTLSAEAKKGEEEIIVGTSKISENVCVQQQEFGTLEATKLEELKEDKSKEIAETTETIEATSDHTLPIKTSQPDNIFSSESVSEQDAHTPKLVEEIHEEETTEAHKIEVMPTGDRDLPVETSQADNTPCSELVSDVDDQTPKQVEEIHEEETKETHKLHSEEILPTDIIPRESSDETLVSILASKEDDQVTLQEDNCAGDVKETKGTQEERPVSVETKESVEETKPKEHVETPTSPIISEKNDNETMIAEGKKGDEYINEKETTMALDSSCTSTTSENVGIEQEEFENHEAPKLEESKEEKIQEIPETDEAIDSTGEHSLPVETSQEYQTPSSDLASGLYDQTPKQIEEVHEEKTKEEHKLFAVDQIRPVETSQEDQTPSLVSEKDYQIPKRVEEIHEEETQKIQAEEILFTETVPRELFSEAPVSMLASGEDEPATPQEGNCAGDKQVEQHVSAETEEMVGETKPKESKAEGTEKSDDQVENSTELTKVEDESRKKTDVEVAELTNDYPIEEAEHGDETYSTLPVVGILTELQNTLETKRAINDSASSEENRIKEPADQEQGKCDAEVESNEKDCVSDIIETEEYKEEVKVQDDISRELEVNVEEKIQEETKEIAEVLPCETIIISSSPLPSEKLEHVISAEKQEEREPQQDFNGSTSEKISLQEEHPRDFETSKEQKEETHEAVKEEDQIVDIKEEKKDKEEQEKFSSKVKKDKEDASKLGIGHDVATPEVEKEEVRCSVLGNVEEIDEVVISEKQIKNPVGVIKKASEAEHESKEEHIETQAISDDTIKSNNDKFSTEQAPKDQREEVSADKYLTKEAIGEQLQIPSSTVLDYFQENSIPEAVTDLADRDLSVKNPSELIQSHQSPNQVEETSFEVEKAQEDKNANVLITNENVQVEDQPKDFEAPAIEKETSEQEQKSNDLTDVQIRGDDVQDIGKNVKPEVLNDEIRGDGHDSVLVPKEETCLIEEKRKVEHVKTEQEDAIKREVFVGEKNKTSENIDRDEAAKEIYQEESKQINTVKEEIKEKEETNQDYFNNVKNSHDAIEKTQSKTGEIKSLSSVSKAQDKSEQKDEVPNQQKREITNEVPKLENPKIAEELQQKDGESENSKDLFSEVKETEPPLKEPARKSLSDLIQKVKGTNKTEDATTEPHIEEESKTVEEDENEDGDHEHDKDDKTSPDSIVMVEAKDTVSIIKTHKKSHGILSGVGSKVKHSISKVKKVLTGKSSHTAKPSSPK